MTTTLEILRRSRPNKGGLDMTEALAIAATRKRDAERGHWKITFTFSGHYWSTAVVEARSASQALRRLQDEKERIITEARVSRVQTKG